jgi:ketosteroid isomerase-like protein
MNTTQEVLDRHLKCFAARDLKGILADYAPETIFLSPRGLFTPDGISKGIAATGQIFEKVFAEFGKPGASFEMKQVSIEGDYAYISWRAETADNVYEPASDTFAFRGGKIVAQSFAGKVTPKQ